MTKNTLPKGWHKALPPNRCDNCLHLFRQTQEDHVTPEWSLWVMACTLHDCFIHPADIENHLCPQHQEKPRAVAEAADDPKNWTYICGISFPRGRRWFQGTFGKQYIAVTADPTFAVRLTYAEMNELWGALAEIYGKENVLMERVQAKS